MTVTLSKKDLLSISDLEAKDIPVILEAARICKAKQNAGEVFVPLLGKTLVMIFNKPSARTRISFDLGMYQLGGHAITLTDAEIGLGKRESVKDVGRLLSRYGDGVLIRTFSHPQVEDLAAAATIPVINGLTDFEHPCQVLSDLFTIQEKKGKVAGLTVAFVGDGNNVANSWAYAAALAGIRLRISSPKPYELTKEVLAEARSLVGASKGSIDLVENPREAVKDADVVYTDVWASMGQEAEREERAGAFAAYQVNSSLMKNAKPDAIVMHCLPAHYGEEISEETLEGFQSVIFDQAENRLHLQKALLILLMGNKE